MLLLLFAAGFASAPPPPPPPPAVFEGGPIFYVAEIDILTPGAGIPLLDTLGWADVTWSTLSFSTFPPEGADTLRASDLGYRSLSSDSIGVIPYPPYIAEAFQVDRGIVLPPGEATTLGAWGQITLANDSGLYDGIALTSNGDRRQVRIMRGQKTLDATRGIFLDPSYDTLAPVFYGLGMPWFLAETTLNIPLSDGQYWLSLPVQTDTYSGTGGGYNGDATIASQLIPKTRGTVFNVTPKLIDVVDQIYQYTDGVGAVLNVYEGAAAVFIYDGDTTDLTVGSAAPGHYRTDNSHGCFQLGSVPDPSFSITCDVKGAFPAAGFKTVLADIAYYLLIEDLGLSGAYIDTTSFMDAAANFPFVGGAYYASDSNTTGIQALAYLLTSFGAKPVSNRQGQIQCLNLASLTGSEATSFNLNTTNIVTITPQPLDSTISPPPYRIRVACKHNYTVQTSGLNTATATKDQLQYVASSDQYGSAVNDNVLLAYARPNDLAPFGGALSNVSDAKSVAAISLDLLSGNCRVYEIIVPIEVGLLIDLGDIGKITYPMHDLRGGKYCQIIHESFKSDESQITFLVLVTGLGLGLIDDGDVLCVLDTRGWPTVGTGTPGTLWSNTGVVSIVPGGVAVSGAPVFFGSIGARDILLLGGLGFPTVKPAPGSKQLWNNLNVVCIA